MVKIATAILLAVVANISLACTKTESQTGLDILVHIRSPEFIEQRGNTYGYKGAQGLANWRRTPCEAWVPELKRNSLVIWQHEIEHCQKGAYHN